MKSLTILFCLVLSQQGLSSPANDSNLSMRSYNQARKVLWAGIEALGGLNRIKAVQDFDVTYKEFDSSKGQNTSPKAPDFFVEGGEAQLGLDIAVIAPGHGKVSSISDLRQAVTIRAKK